MKCINEDTVQRYIDRELSLHEIEHIENHLDTCSACKEKIDSRRQLSLDIRQSINRIAPGSIAAPQFVPPSKNIKQLAFYKNRKAVYSLIGVCALLILVLIVISRQEDIVSASFSYSHNFEYDSNLPVDKQPILIQEIDPDGQVTEYYLE